MQLLLLLLAAAPSLVAAGTLRAAIHDTAGPRCDPTGPYKSCGGNQIFHANLACGTGTLYQGKRYCTQRDCCKDPTKHQTAVKDAHATVVTADHIKDMNQHLDGIEKRLKAAMQESVNESEESCMNPCVDLSYETNQIMKPWHERNGEANSCALMVQHNYCTSDYFNTYDGVKVTAAQACCGCGGGGTSQSNPEIVSKDFVIPALAFDAPKDAPGKKRKIFLYTGYLQIGYFLWLTYFSWVDTFNSLFFFCIVIVALLF